MNDFSLSYREVVPDQTLTEQWKEFTLNTGGTQSTLQDIKVPEKACGYCYKDASKYYTRNRFIYWRISKDVLEVVEHSLDVNLSGNRVRFRFQGTPILDGISIHEYLGSVIILVPTVCSVHRLVFKHPDYIHNQNELLGSHPDLAIPSIFSDISFQGITDPSTFYVINNTANTVLPHIAASYLCPGIEEGFFVFGYPTGELLLARLTFSGYCILTELKQETIVPKMLSGIVGALRGKNSESHVAVSVVLHAIGTEIYAITLCRDGNLRIWSCLKGQYVAVSDILAETNDVSCEYMQGGQSHILRKSVNSNDSDFLLAIFLCFSTECQFHILRPTVQDGVFKIVRLYTLHSTEKDLMDFSLDNKRLWSVWRNLNGECYVNSARLDSPAGTHWVPAILNPSLDPEYVNQDPGIDPRQAYVNFIFYPGRFSLSVIVKALSIYKRQPAHNELNVSATILKQRVSLAVEQEIQTEVQEYEVSDEEYIDIVNRCWLKFYSCCVQYHAAGTKPLGLLLLPSVSGVVLLKKTQYSFLRPLDALEQMMLCSESTTVEQFRSKRYGQLFTDTDACSDMIQLMSLLAKLEQQLNEEFKYNIEKELSLLREPDKIMSELVIDLMAGSEEPILSTQFLWSITQTLSNLTDLYKTMHLLLEMLSIDAKQGSCPDQMVSKRMMLMTHLFNSELGISVTSECLHQQAIIRFSICRNLLLLQNILLERRELDWGVLEAIRSVCLPDTVIFMQAYYVVMWLCEQPVIPTTLSDDSTQRLALLKLPPVFNLKLRNKSLMTLIQLFTASSGGAHTHKAFARTFPERDEDILPHWHYSLLGFVGELGQLIWPLNTKFVLDEWLLASGQHLLLQQYVRLLNKYCEWNKNSRNFVLAAALLNNGERFKAKDLFEASADGIFKEQYLKDFVSGEDEENDAKLLINYHLKIIHLFELYNAPDCAIDIAKTALSAADPTDPNIATLHSVTFVHHLSLGHYQEAYSALISNPDSERREDNLRDLVKTLLDNKLLDTLLSFSYGKLEDTFIKIVQARARACDSVRNIFYDFLYSYEIMKDHTQKAAFAMYEQAYRLGQHNTVESLEQQVKCYLSCMNCLYLVEESLQYVTRPPDPDTKENILFIPSVDPTEEVEKHIIKSNVKVLDMEMIKKEAAVATARLRLARYNKRTLDNNFTTPNDLITILTSMGIFKHALMMCKMFSISYNYVFECLTKVCVLLTRKESPKAWDWLVENDLTDLDMVERSPATVCWNLLEMLLFEYEEAGKTSIHRVITKKLLYLRATLPYWLLASYKKRNSAELLRILFTSGRVLEASSFARQYICAALGSGREYFDVDVPLVASERAQCVPVYTMEEILCVLEELGQSKKAYRMEYVELKQIFGKYLEISQRVSNDKIRQLLTSNN